MKIYNKLVRDKIPQIIEKNGQTALVRRLNDEEYLAELDKKLGEEFAEYQADKSVEELADLLEVVYAIAEARGYTVDGLEKVRAEKAAKRGGFAEKLFLEYVGDNGRDGT